ncbi:acyl-CoA thioester hydrolase [Paracoccus pantotrophus]|nr:acyl-CoA thioester hydrolase [Paracoccus pantotrophus]
MEDQVAPRLLARMSIPVRWGDMDAAGHVNNTVYFRFAEEIRLTWFQRMGFGAGLGHGEGPVIVNASMTFLRQLHHPASVIVTMTASNPGRSSFDTDYELTDAGDPGTVYARGSARCVWIDYATAKSAPMPDRLRKAILDPSPITAGL